MKVTISASLNIEQVKKLKEIANKKGMKRSKIVEKALKEYFEKRDEKDNQG